MKSISKIFVNIACILGFVLSLFLLVPQTADAACEVFSYPDSKFRTSSGPGGVQSTEWYDADNPPFVYVDLKTQGCQNTDIIYLTIFGLANTEGVRKVLTDYLIPISLLPDGSSGSFAFKPTEEACYGNNNDNGGRECLMIAMFTSKSISDSNSAIIGLIGDLIGSISLEQGQIFANAFGSALPAHIGCQPTNGYFYKISSGTCNLEPYYGYNVQAIINMLFTYQNSDSDQKLIDFYNTHTSENYVRLSNLADPLLPVATLGFPALLYDCDGVCNWNDDDWQSIGTIPYGETHPDDQGAVTVDSLPSNYQQDYIPLAPLPFDGLNGGTTPTLGEYLAGVFKAGIIIIIILSVIMIVFHAIAYMTVGAISGKTEHRENIWNAILGLLIALGSWLLLNTISPNLASNLSISIPNVSLDGYEYIEDGRAVIPSNCPKPEFLPALCINCQTIVSGIEVKSNLSNTISASLNQKLLDLSQTLSVNQINWRVTEAFPPSLNVDHCALCHYRGTCVDANFVLPSTPTVESIQSFIQATSTAGLRAVYETNDENVYTTLKEAGIQLSKKGKKIGNLLFLQGITAPHFSVYND